jgi:hypothetical protein
MPRVSNRALLEQQGQVLSTLAELLEQMVEQNQGIASALKALKPVTKADIERTEQALRAQYNPKSDAETDKALIAKAPVVELYHDGPGPVKLRLNTQVFYVNPGTQMVSSVWAEQYTQWKQDLADADSNQRTLSNPKIQSQQLVQLARSSGLHAEEV